MSGIVGIVNLDGVPVDRELLRGMTGFLAFRGPDAQATWIDGPVGFGHTLLKTTFESEFEHQPFTLDGKVWIVADARVDARADLIHKLDRHSATGILPVKDHGQDGHATDVELILRAYHAWGQECVDHLIGDFAFAIWDGREQRLFCARDHMGVKPFYYAHVGNCVVFSNTLDCVRLHPAVSDRLNDLAVADFLLFDLNQDKSTTTFADIQRIPPAHCARWSESGLQLRGYWTLPIDEPIYYERLDDYVDRFKELLGAAVDDRLRTKRVGIFMSGGLDSPALAATANKLLLERKGNSGVRAFTISYEGYDEERHYAGLVAASLDISIDFEGWNDDMADPGWIRTPFHTPEPIPYPTSLAPEWAYHRRVASYSRVALYGEGPDNALLHEWAPYVSYLVRRRRFGRLLYDAGCFTILHRRLPFPSLRRFAIRRPPNEAPASLFPDWLNPDFERRLDLRTRWKGLLSEAPASHLVRPAAYRSFGYPLWLNFFESYDAALTRCALEVRHPYFDVRVLRYLLAVPVVPWCRAKYLMRRSMRGILPPSILRRPKSPLVRHLWSERVMEYGQPPLAPAGGIDQYVDIDRLRRAGRDDPKRFWVNFRTRSLNYWLRNLRA